MACRTSISLIQLCSSQLHLYFIKYLFVRCCVVLSPVPAHVFLNYLPKNDALFYLSKSVCFSRALAFLLLGAVVVVVVYFILSRLLYLAFQLI